MGSVVDNTGRWYVNNQGLPWAIEVAAEIQWPAEGKRLEQVYPLFVSWVESGGEANTDWYLHGDPEYLYNLLLPPARARALPRRRLGVVGDRGGAGRTAPGQIALARRLSTPRNTSPGRGFGLPCRAGECSGGRQERGNIAMTATASSPTDQLHFTAEEILSSGSFAEPLIANGVRCHGGFDEAGNYRSPRVLFRDPAIAAWQNQLRSNGHELFEIAPELMPPSHPSVAQAKLLLQNGVREPLVRTLTIISIVEGFGAMIRDVKVPELENLIVEPIDGTALAHLTEGLFEAHARDESGYREEGGHKQMWEAARDAALENPKIPGDVLMRLMGRRESRGPAQAALPGDRGRVGAHAGLHGERAGRGSHRRRNLPVGHPVALGPGGLCGARRGGRHGGEHPRG